MSRALTAVAAVVLAVSLAGAELQLDELGLASALPLPYYLALAVLPLASALAWQRAGPLAALVPLVVYVAAVWLTPVLLEGTPRFRTSYTSFGYVDAVTKWGGLDRDLFIYHNWPIFPLGFAALVEVSGIEPLTLMKWFPTAIVLLYLVPLAALLRTASPRSQDSQRGAGEADSRWLAGLWLFAVFNWSGQDYFSPQALAYLLFLIWLALLARVAVLQKGRFEAFDAAATILVFVLIVETHVLTAMAAVFVFAALTAFRLVSRPGMLIACLLIFLGWQAWVAEPFFAEYAERLRETVLAAGEFLNANLFGRLRGDPDHAIVTKLRLLTTGVAFALGAAGLIHLALRRPWSAAARFALATLVGLALVTPVSAYGGEMLIRTLLFSLPLLGILVLHALDRRWMRVALVISLMVASPLHVLTRYGNEYYDYVSPGELAGFEHLSQKLAPANVYGGYPGGAFERPALIDWRNGTLPSATEPLRSSDFLRPAQHHWRRDDWPIYVALSRGDRASASLFYARPGFIDEVRQAIDEDPHFEPVYVTADYSIYRWRRDVAGR